MNKECLTDKCKCGHYRVGHNKSGCFVTPLGGEPCECDGFVLEDETNGN